MIKWIKSVGLWLLKKENREAGIKATKQAMDLFDVVARHTKTSKDDKAAAFIAKQFDKALKINDIFEDKEVKAISKEVTKETKGSLKNVTLGLDKGTITAGVGKIGVKYDPSNGNVKFGFSL
jgi:hypothetical protein